jgi:hypothetical protein
MTPWNLSEKEFYDWAVRKIAEDTRLEELEDFIEKFPSEELKHIYTVLDEHVMPALTANGVPISKEECHKLFRSWFVRTNSQTPTREGQPFGTTTKGKVYTSA